MERHLQHNHKGEPFSPLAIFTWVAQESTGSYGLLYVHDEEDERQHNEFPVYILKSGKLLKTKDSFLSSYEEEVEQTYDADNLPLDWKFVNQKTTIHQVLALERSSSRAYLNQRLTNDSAALVIS
jgi:hypothetical protein